MQSGEYTPLFSCIVVSTKINSSILKERETKRKYLQTLRVQMQSGKYTIF